MSAAPLTQTGLMTDYVESILRPLIDHPEALCITELAGEKTHLVEVRCHPDDRGKLIGKSGKTIGAVRTLLSVLAAREGRRAVIEVVQ